MWVLASRINDVALEALLPRMRSRLRDDSESLSDEMSSSEDHDEVGVDVGGSSELGGNESMRLERNERYICSVASEALGRRGGPKANRLARRWTRGRCVLG